MIFLLFILFTTETIHVKHVTIQHENYHATVYRIKPKQRRAKLNSYMFTVQKTSAADYDNLKCRS